jgi:hypothetical protein
VRRILILAVALLAAAAAPAAQAHGGNPNYRSVLHGVTPQVKGLSVSVLGYDNQLQLINHTGRDVTVLGYNGEPFARVLADGTVQENIDSPAYYLNQDREGTTKVPSFATAKAPPKWKTLDKTGRLIWHDHRMHWMGSSTPQQVRDKHKKTKIFDYQLPIRVGTQPVKASGTLFWVGQNTSVPIAPIAIIVAALLIGIPLLIRRQRRRDHAADGAQPAPEREPQEVGAGAKEAW